MDLRNQGGKDQRFRQLHQFEATLFVFQSNYEDREYWTSFQAQNSLVKR